jgi:uncharacterized membrane protein YgcG
MGGDRNAPLPPGTSVPRRKQAPTHNASNTPLLLPQQRSKSCYDPDIDPLYCAWGIDVYDLFVNTKSDLGPNPCIPDDGARQEYRNLPPHEQERLGFEGLLFSKLSDLVRQCDRTVTRNKEKLQQEIQQQMQKRDFRDYVEDIDDVAVEELARLQLQIKSVEEELLGIVGTMEKYAIQEEELNNKKKELEELVSVNMTKTDKSSGNDATDETENKDSKEETATGKSDVDANDRKKENDTNINGETTTAANMQEAKEDKETETPNHDNEPTETQPSSQEELQKLELEQITKELDDIIIKKQRSLFDLARKMQEYAPLQESAEQQLKQLHYIKSDITMDKTVCEVSGNFMSARDADERIAAHYAGKQYVGWKLVRDKLKEMQKEYGRYGPPSAQRAPPRRGMEEPSRRSAGSYNDDRRRVEGRGGYDRGGPSQPPRGNYGGSRDRSGGGFYGGGGRGGGGGYGGRGGGGRRDGRWGR